MKNLVIGIIIGILVAALGVGIYLKVKGSACADGDTKETDEKVTGDSQSIQGKEGEKKDDKNSPVKEEPLQPKIMDPVSHDDVDRLQSRRMKGQFEMIGRGEDAKWGIGTVANFKYTVITSVESRILKKEKLAHGRVKVTEIRKFDAVQDSLVVSDVDFVFTPQTLPLDTFARVVDFCATAWAGLTGDVTGAGVVIKGTHELTQKLKKADGMSLTKLFGLNLLPESTKNKINKIIESRLTRAMGLIRPISGKSYKITYYQEATGEPLYVSICYENGEEVIEEEEKMVLKRINAFIDSNTIPNKDVAPGDSWTLNVKVLEQLFDPFVDGDYHGVLKATRMSNNENGEWVISLDPGTIDIINDSGTSTGSLKVKEGKATADPDTICLKDMFVNGHAKMEKLTKHHLLFTARLSGECEFQARMVTEDLK